MKGRHRLLIVVMFTILCVMEYMYMLYVSDHSPPVPTVDVDRRVGDQTVPHIETDSSCETNPSNPETEPPEDFSTYLIAMIDEINNRTEGINVEPRDIARASLSKMELVDTISTFTLGDDIQVEIQLYDGHNRPKSTGGDFVRVWMTDTAMEASAAGVVIDNNDGTYTGSVKALWAGNPVITAAVSNPKETMDAFKRIYRDHVTLRHFSALFESDGVKEETLCLPVPQLPGHGSVCNLTAQNYGLPWYCGKPSGRKLLCQDFVGLRVPPNQPTFFTKKEMAFFTNENLHQKLPVTIQVSVKSDHATVALPSRPCNQTPLNDSWAASTPVGFFYKGSWNSLTCKETVDSSSYRNCLKDITLWINGDSTSRNWFWGFMSLLKLDLTESWHHTKWHKASTAVDKTNNISVRLIPHEYPFYHGDVFAKMAYNKATHAYIDELPNDSKDIFVIHMYLHFNPFPPYVYRTHIKRIAKSVTSLVSRAPGVKIAIRGPHAFKGRRKVGFIDDMWMKTYDDIIREEFKGLESKVLYLNNKDLTIATDRAGNDDQHPGDQIIEALQRHFMSYVCSN